MSLLMIHADLGQVEERSTRCETTPDGRRNNDSAGYTCRLILCIRRLRLHSRGEEEDPTCSKGYFPRQSNDGCWESIGRGGGIAIPE